MLATINWINRGLASDRFESTFGEVAELVRSVVDAGIDAWERMIDDLHLGGDLYAISVSISMQASGTGFGGTSDVTFEFDGNTRHWVGSARSS